jgi:hypothetical protein
MSDGTIEAIKARYIDVFSAPLPQQDVPRAASLARADIPKLLEMVIEQEKKFEMLGFCLAATLIKSGGHVDIPTQPLLEMAAEMKSSGLKYTETSFEINEVEPGLTRISLVRRDVVKESDLLVPVVMP